MEGFVAQKPPLSKRLGGFVGLGVAAIVVLGLVAAYLYKHSPSENEVEPTPPPSSVSHSETKPSETKEAPKAKTLAVTPDSTPPAVPTTALAALPEPSASASASPRSSPEAKIAESSQVQIEFDLSTKDLMERLSQESDTPLDIGRYTIAVVPQFKTKYDAVRSEQGFKQLATETRNLAMGQPSLVFRGGKEPKSNETIGFYVEVTPSRQTDRGPEYKIAVKRSLPELGPSGDLKVSTQNFEETITVPHNAAVVFAGLLPRKQQLVDGEDDLYKGNILSPLLDPSFEKGDEEFLIVVNPHFGETN